MDYIFFTANWHNWKIENNEYWKGSDKIETSNSFIRNIICYKLFRK